MPDESEPRGLLALMRLHLARAAARFAADGSLVLLAEQDRAAWDHAAIAHASSLLERALRMGRVGPYQLQAAIVACHANAASYGTTDWQQIVGLYDGLLSVQATPVVALNRAVALAELSGPAAGLAAVDPLAEALAVYHLYHATRRALALTDNPAEQRLLRERLAQAGSDRSGGPT